MSVISYVMGFSSLLPSIDVSSSSSYYLKFICDTITYYWISYFYSLSLSFYYVKNGSVITYNLLSYFYSSSSSLLPAPLLKFYYLLFIDYVLDLLFYI